jgi:hypothetical protein
MTYKDVISCSDVLYKYDHPFDFVISTVREIRKLKATFNMASKTIDRAYVHVKNDELKLGMLLDSGFNIARLCKVNQFHVYYFDDTNLGNNIHVSFGENDSFIIYMQDHTDTGGDT